MSRELVLKPGQEGSISENFALPMLWDSIITTEERDGKFYSLCSCYWMAERETGPKSRTMGEVVRAHLLDVHLVGMEAVFVKMVQVAAERAAECASRLSGIHGMMSG